MCAPHSFDLFIECSRAVIYVARGVVVQTRQSSCERKRRHDCCPIHNPATAAQACSLRCTTTSVMKNQPHGHTPRPTTAHFLLGNTAACPTRMAHVPTAQPSRLSATFRRAWYTAHNAACVSRQAGPAYCTPALTRTSSEKHTAVRNTTAASDMSTTVLSQALPSVNCTPAWRTQRSSRYTRNSQAHCWRWHRRTNGLLAGCQVRHDLKAIAIVSIATPVTVAAVYGTAPCSVIPVCATVFSATPPPYAATQPSAGGRRMSKSGCTAQRLQLGCVPQYQYTRRSHAAERQRTPALMGTV